MSSTDRVGTKLKLALEAREHSTIGIDLVAMCVNDLVVCGAEPLFFLDYYATSQLRVDIAEQVIKGIAEGCKMAGASLVGGETAEMPGMYEGEDYDLAGFCVGVVEKETLITGHSVKPGDVLLGLASSGPHSNGYSLIRKILETKGFALDTPLEGKPLLHYLLEPTKIYVKPLLELLKTTPIKAMAHITGGGLLENIPRVLPSHTAARINYSSWEMPLIFHWLQEQGQLSSHELWRTFNCGIGMVLCIDPHHLQDTLDELQDLGETAFLIGDIISSEEKEPFVMMES